MHDLERELRRIIAMMKSNHDSHRNYIKLLEQALSDHKKPELTKAANPNRITL